MGTMVKSEERYCPNGLPTLIKDGTHYYVPIPNTLNLLHYLGRNGDAFLVNGISVSQTIIHEQNTPSATWIFNHNTGNKRSIELFNLQGEKINGDIVIVSNNQTRAEFLTPIAGFAILK